MKDKAPRIHLLETDEALVCWNCLVARCGHTFKRAEPVWMFREGFKPTDFWLEGFSTLSVCQKCIANPPNTADDERDYLYGLVEAVPRFAEHNFGIQDPL